MTTTHTQKSRATLSNPPQEDILVVKREILFQNTPAWHGLKTDQMDTYLELIHAHKEFLPRADMENDLAYKQVIPYLVFQHGATYFLMQRAAQSTETRLKNKYSLGIGGHIRQDDMTTDSIFDWARREFHEEVSYQDAFTVTPLGILNDDSNAVGQVHVGFVFLLKGVSSHISIKSELQAGELLDIEAMRPYEGQMESWSQLVYQALQKI